MRKVARVLDPFQLKKQTGNKSSIPRECHVHDYDGQQEGLSNLQNVAFPVISHVTIVGCFFHQPNPDRKYLITLDL
jgi:hypothetical protein